MKICPVCNDSFADQLNFCDIDGTRLRRADSAPERNKWWSLLGAGLLVGALVISAASMFFLPKARVSAPIVNSEPESTPASSKEASAENSAAVAAGAGVSAEPETVPTVAIVPEMKKKDKALDEENVTRAVPNPKAAALAAEEPDKKLTSTEVKDAAAASKKSEASPSAGTDADGRSAESPTKPQPSDLKKETKTSTPVAKESDKDSDKNKNDEKDKKKGGFLRVFKKIFGKN